MNQSTYTSKQLSNTARRLFNDCRKAAKAQGVKADLIRWVLDVSNHGARVRVEYLMDGLTQHSTEVL